EATLHRAMPPMRPGDSPDDARKAHSYDRAMDSSFWIDEAVHVGILATVAYLAGLLAGVGVKVSYTRKVNFFAIFLTPLALARTLPAHHGGPWTTALHSIVGLAMFLPLTKPIRTRVPLFGTMFRSFDRREDAPHTLLWLTVQILGAYAVMIPMG